MIVQGSAPTPCGTRFRADLTFARGYKLCYNGAMLESGMADRDGSEKFDETNEI